jgi:aldehyde dehydrogenase (NAD+)
MTLTDWTYSPAPESSAIAAIKDRYLPYIDGTFVEGGGSDWDTINPGTGEKLSTVSLVNSADVDRAIAAARHAYDKVWSTMPGAERGKYLFRIARGIAERSRELAVVETLDNGSRSRRPATSTCRPLRSTSSTTPAGRTSCSTSDSARRPRRWAWPAR